MAKPDASAKFAPIKRRFGLRDLLRVVLWGASAAAMLFVAVLAATTDVGRERLFVGMAEIREIVIPSGAKPVRPLDANEGRRLAETVRALTIDRDRLLERIASLEQTIDGVTGSIARVEKAASWATMPPVPPAQAPPAAAVEPEEVTSSISPPNSPADVPMPPPQPGSIVNKTEFGLDLGGANSVEALRTAWTAALRRHGPLLEGLRPVVHMRERPRPNAMEFRLIAGPIGNAASAARLCATITAAGAICAPALFEGQRLAVR
ncbi:MAG: hypothetical protein WCG92_16255 [Hyphomicrobiales bacterium]|nr:hypothetical protein [Alphaproteobacteria bacterium]